jgi:nucleoside 2-deoxyribosyltransferase
MSLGKKIYWAAPLFNDEERAFNSCGCAKFECDGYTVFLPQRDAGELGTDGGAEEIYWRDIKGLCACDIVVAVLNGRVPDEGTVFEMGYANALGKPIFGICSDKRKPTNAMFAPVNWCDDTVGALDAINKAIVTEEIGRKLALNS